MNDHTMTRRFFSGAALAIPAALAHAAGSPLLIGSGLPGGVYNVLGQAMARIITRDAPGITAVPHSTGGGIGTIELLARQPGAIGFSGVDVAMNAYDGEWHFRGAKVGVRALAVLYNEQMHLVTRAEAGIRTIADLRGKRVSTGAQGSGTDNMSFRLLTVAGIDYTKDFSVRARLDPLACCDALRAGTIDAFFFCSGTPNQAIRTLAASPGLSIALIDHAHLSEGVVARYGPVYYPEAIEAGTYPGQNADNQQVSVSDVLLARDDLPPSQATAILHAIWSARADLTAAHAVGAKFTLDRQTTALAGIPWHPAAEAFWTAMGGRPA